MGWAYVNVEPLPGWLLHSIEPPMARHSRPLRASPRPDPPHLRPIDESSCEKGCSVVVMLCVCVRVCVCVCARARVCVCVAFVCACVVSVR